VRRTIPLLSTLSLLVLLALGAPRLSSAADGRREVFDPWAAETSSPAEQALTGGVIRLKAPGSRMIKVRASSFYMGSTVPDVLEAVAECAREPHGHRCKEELFANELPQHRVKLSAYWLDRTEVTVADYRRCVELRRCDAPPYADGARRFDRPSFPVTLVRHQDAVAFCKFRRARLPTEAEFERAARGIKGRRYPWGTVYNSRAANHGRLGLDRSDKTDGFAELAPVGSFPAGRTPDGFVDLAGNAAEWVADRYAPGYADSATVDPRGPSGSGATSERVIRGGSFSSPGPWLRGSARDSAEPDSRSPEVGFRCARSAGPRGAAKADHPD
jgi:formylglycine-generating enzyme required for sulfatase activity